jgi:hypothetical protein
MRARKIETNQIMIQLIQALHNHLRKTYHDQVVLYEYGKGPSQKQGLIVNIYEKDGIKEELTHYVIVINPDDSNQLSITKIKQSLVQTVRDSRHFDSLTHRLDLADNKLIHFMAFNYVPFVDYSTMKFCHNIDLHAPNFLDIVDSIIKSK